MRRPVQGALRVGSDRLSHEEYPREFVAGLEWIWGEGFLSPGGPQEVAAILEGIDLRARQVLDFGCGLGGIDVLLATVHGAGGVVGIDIEPDLVERARETVRRAGVGERVELQLVEPGPLPFEDGSFDVVFSKDSIIHVADKPALYADIARVLRPGGIFVGSDWLRGGDGPQSAAMRDWLDYVGLTFAMRSAEEMCAEVEAAGFEQVRTRDRNEWYREEVKREIEAVEGERGRALAELAGAEAAARRLRSSTLKLEVVERGELRPTHFHARRLSRARDRLATSRRESPADSGSAP